MADVSPSELRLVTDKAAIDALIQGWMFRGIAQWDKLRTLFHRDGRMEASWFQGLFSDFVDASMRMGASNLRTKHVMGTPIISPTRDKAIAETNAIIVCDNAVCNLDATHTTASLILLRDVITTGRFSGDIFFMT